MSAAKRMEPSGDIGNFPFRKEYLERDLGLLCEFETLMRADILIWRRRKNKRLCH